jgi:capsular exopolysaccharide synthesis family protein
MSLGVPPALGPADLNVQDYLDILRRRKWTILQTLAVIVAIGVVTTAMTTPIYRANGKLYVEMAVSQINTINSENPLAGLLALSQPDNVQTQIQLLQSEPFVEDVYKEHHIPHEIRGITPSIQVAQVEGTNVIRISVESADPKQGAALVNGMMEKHVEKSSILSAQGVKDAIKYLEPETERAGKVLVAAEAALLDFRRKHRVPEMMAQAESRTRELVELETHEKEIGTAIDEKKVLLARAQQKLTTEPEERLRVTTNANTHRAAIQARIYELEYQRKALLQDYKPNHPKVRTIDGLLDEERRQRDSEPTFLKVPSYVPNQRRERLENEAAGLEQELQALSVQQSVTHERLLDRRTRVNDIGNWEGPLAVLNRNREQAEKTYRMLLDKLQDLHIREKANRSFTKIVETAGVPLSPIRPRKAVNLLFASLAGLFFGICMAFLQEFLDDRINSLEEVDRLTGLPGLAHIALIPGEASKLITDLPPHSPITESYRGLRSAITFSSIEAPISTLLVSSTVKGEGKSLTAANLAIAMAFEGRRVVLVDADLRRPSIHRLMDLPLSPGLTDVLAEQATLEHALQPTSIPGLTVLPAGTIPPNPAELLNSEPMDRLIDALRDRSDAIVFDTPPCLPVTDVQVLSSRVDGVVLVVEVGEARKAALQHAKRLFDQAHARTLGIVFNKIPERTREGQFYYRRGYYLDEPQPLRNGKDVPTNGNGNGNGHARAALGPSDEEARRLMEQNKVRRGAQREEER